MITRIERRVSENLGVRTGDALCLATIAFIFAIVFGLIG